MNNFTPAEVRSAKRVKDEVIKMQEDEPKSIYMAGEICMWDELKEQLEKASKWDALNEKIAKAYEEDSKADLTTIGEDAAIAFGYL